MDTGTKEGKLTTLRVEEHNTIARLTLKPGVELQLPADDDSRERYLQDARKILKKMDKEFNAIGKNMLVAALVYEILER